MLMVPVKSSNIKAVGYESETQQLRVQFKLGSTYNYDEVPETAYQSLMGASSIGSHHSVHIKGKYKHTKHIEPLTGAESGK